MPVATPTLTSLLEGVDDLVRALVEAPDECPRAVHARLRDSVVHPLRPSTPIGRATAESAADRSASDPNNRSAPADSSGGAEPSWLGDRLWQLASAATALRVRSPDTPALAEATAALQDLALTRADESSKADRLAELRALQAKLVPQIQVMTNGPYLVTNPRALLDWLGRPLPQRPQLALCRCGRSALKPLCDGAHARNGFTDAKDPKRVPDRRETYIGQQVTVLDNRGTCQHSGLCTDRLAAVFRQGVEPFIAPSGGRMDEIIRAVRDCPSGALSYAIDGVEARHEVDCHGTRESAIVVGRDGPYRITGGIPLVDHDGTDVTRNEGASLEHYALCRCGHSQNKPFCSGMHWYVEFRDPVADADRTPTIFEWAGGLPALTRMTRFFYEKYVPQDPLLAPVFANMTADHPERVAKWLAEVFGGPAYYSEEHGGYPRMLSQHVGKRITEEHRLRWVALLLQAARDAGLPNDPEFRSVFQSYIEWGSRLAVENSQQDAHPPLRMPMPHWDWNTAAGPPGSRVSALATPAAEDEPAVILPGADQPVSFAAHVKPLFRRRDRQSMQFVFDLWAYDDVCTHADAILERLRNGTMPCDGAWPPERLTVFEGWMRDGKRP
jgi:CDGSH-type Zn-finger protein/truncated hemoglobin YjbI